MLGEKSPWSAKSDAPWLTISLPDGRGSKVKMVIWSPWSAWWDFSLIGLLGSPNLWMFIWPEAVLVVCLYLPVCLNIKAVQTDIYCGKGAEIWFCHICLMVYRSEIVLVMPLPPPAPKWRHSHPRHQLTRHELKLVSPFRSPASSWFFKFFLSAIGLVFPSACCLLA